MLALSLIGYFLWEQPIRQRRLFPNRRVFFAVLAGFTLVLVSAGAVIFQMRGIPQRLPSDLVAAGEALDRNSFLIAKRCPDVLNEAPASCPLGDEAAGKVSFVIIGDSHAQAVAAEIGDLAKSYHLGGLYLGKAGCTPLAGLSWRKDTSCAQQNEFALRKIQESNPSLVILISRWTDLLGDPVTGRTPVLLSNGDPVSEADRPRTVASALDRTLDMLGSRKVVTALVVPEYDWKTPIVWREWMMRLGIPSTNDDLSLEMHRERQVYTKSLLADARRKHENLDIVNPEGLFCSENICRYSEGDNLLYWDGNHLSHAGAAIYASLFQPALSDLAATRASPRP